jgi:hypothetical protein
VRKFSELEVNLSATPTAAAAASGRGGQARRLLR